MPLPYRAFQVGNPEMNGHEFVKFNVEHFTHSTNIQKWLRWGQ